VKNGGMSKMSLAQLKFQYLPRDQKIRNYMEVQRSVNLLFDILEVYGRLEKNLSKIKNQNCNQVCVARTAQSCECKS